MTPLSIQSIAFSNFKALVQTTLPLGRFTLIVGPNGSGKSTALQAIQLLKRGNALWSELARLQSVTRSGDANAPPEIKVAWEGLPPGSSASLTWQQSTHSDLSVKGSTNRLRAFLSTM